jgi:hypothetical protein
MASLNKQDSQLADANDKPMIGAQQAAITAAVAVGSTFDDAEVNLIVDAVNALISALEAHGLVASND